MYAEGVGRTLELHDAHALSDVQPKTPDREGGRAMTGFCLSV